MSEEWKTCPFNQSHRVAPERFLIHVGKCARANPGVDLVRCGYNGTHYVPSAELQAHEDDCPQGKPWRELLKKIPGLPLTSTTQAKPTNHNTTADEENWDESPEIQLANNNWAPDVGDWDKSPEIQSNNNNWDTDREDWDKSPVIPLTHNNWDTDWEDWDKSPVIPLTHNNWDTDLEDWDNSPESQPTSHSWLSDAEDWDKDPAPSSYDPSNYIRCSGVMLTKAYIGRSRQEKTAMRAKEKERVWFYTQNQDVRARVNEGREHRGVAK